MVDPTPDNMKAVIITTASFISLDHIIKLAEFLEHEMGWPDYDIREEKCCGKCKKLHLVPALSLIHI